MLIKLILQYSSPIFPIYHIFSQNESMEFENIRTLLYFISLRSGFWNINDKYKHLNYNTEITYIVGQYCLKNLSFYILRSHIYCLKMRNLKIQIRVENVWERQGMICLMQARFLGDKIEIHNRGGSLSLRHSEHGMTTTQWCLNLRRQKRHDKCKILESLSNWKG